MKSFESRVNKVLKDGDLTVADLRDWFKRPYATVWRWVHSGWVPRGPDGRRAVEDLTRLERLISQGRHFPVPSYIGYLHRPRYVKGVYDAAAGVPKAGAAR